MSTPVVTVPITVYDYELRADGTPIQGAEIEVSLGYDQGTFSPSGGTAQAFVEPNVFRTVTDGNGYWSLSLLRNSDIAPLGTYYVIKAPTRRYRIQIASGTTDPSLTSALRIVTPASLAAGGGTVTGPLSVSGEMTAADFKATGVAALANASSARFIGSWTTVGSPTGLTAQLDDFGFDSAGTLWVCTAAGSPGTWAQIGGVPTSQQSEEFAGSILVNGGVGLSTHFPGTTIPTGWAWRVQAMTDTYKNSSVALGGNPGVNNGAHFARSFAPAGAFRLESRVKWYYGGDSNTGGHAAGAQMMVLSAYSGANVDNGSSTDWTGVIIGISGAGVQAWAVNPVSTWSMLATGGLSGTGITGKWIYLRIDGNAAHNSYDFYYSLDRNFWEHIANVAFAFTPAAMGFRLVGSSVPALEFSVDFIDTVS